MTDKKVIVQFTIVVFLIACCASGIVIALGHRGFSVHSTVYEALRHPGANLPYAVYILSPAIASYIVLKKNRRVTGLREWLRAVFHAPKRPSLYLFVAAGLALYFGIHLAAAGPAQTALPFYMLFLNLPGNLVIGGLEEAGWTYILQPGLDKACGYLRASLFTGIIWLLWHIPLFFIPGTGHYEGLIDFGMFAVNILAFRFFYGAICRISGKSRVFLGVLFHTLFNAASPVLGILPMTWAGTLAANAAIVLVSVLTVAAYGKRSGQAA